MEAIKGDGKKTTYIPTQFDTDINDYDELMVIYRAAVEQVVTRINAFNDELNEVHKYYPIEHIESRIKTAQSMSKKLKRDNKPVTVENMAKFLNDVAGVRIICSFIADIYRVAEILKKQPDIEIIKTKDYIIFPKESGYRSYHMIIRVPIYFSDRVVRTKVEIQIRTVAMDFWASLEHKINYKFERKIPKHIINELVECSKMVSDLDNKMMELNDEILKLPDSSSDAVGLKSEEK